MKLQNKALIVFLGLIVIVVTVFCTQWFSKSKLENQKMPEIQKTPSVESPVKENAVGEEAPKLQPTEPVADTRTAFEKDRKQLIDNKNIIEVVAFKTRNDLLYLSKDQGDVSIFGASIDEQDAVSQPKLLEKAIIETGMKGMWNISTGKAFDNFLYLSDAAKEKRINIYSLNTLTKNNSISLDEGPLFVSPLLTGLDDRIIFAKQTPDSKALEIVSSTFDLKNKKNIYTVKLTQGQKDDVLGWMDMSSDDKKLLFTLKDGLTGKYVLFTVDLSIGMLQKLTNDGENLLTAKWSKDGRKIVYSKQEEANVSNIFVYDFDKGSTVQITSGKNKSYCPDWSYYGDKIVYITEEKGIGGLYLINYK